MRSRQKTPINSRHNELTAASGAMRGTRESLPSIGFVSTYPPTKCGIATFTTALRSAIAANRGSGDRLGVVSLVTERAKSTSREVLHQHLNGDPGSLTRAAEALNALDVAVIQHEYGIYGGPDGAEVLDLVSSLDIPVVITLHTVPKYPTSGHRMILESLIQEADKTIVLSQSAFRQLKDRYEVNDENVLMIPHGAKPSLGAPPPNPGTRPLLLTWGFIGPGKGLETAIEALAGLKDLRPVPRYVVLGVTHPKVRAAEGDAYLQRLMARVRALGLAHIVEFDNRYVDLDSQTNAIRQADIVLIPYDSTDQVTSGVLVEAIAAGKPVVATAFPHAVEMLGTGAGTVVPPADPDALAEALRDLLTDPSRAAQMAKVSRSIAPTLYWPTVASKYETILATLVPKHLTTLHLTESGRRQPVDGLVRSA